MCTVITPLLPELLQNTASVNNVRVEKYFWLLYKTGSLASFSASTLFITGLANLYLANDAFTMLASKYF